MYTPATMRLLTTKKYKLKLKSQSILHLTEPSKYSNCMFIFTCIQIDYNTIKGHIMMSKQLNFVCSEK